MIGQGKMVEYRRSAKEINFCAAKIYIKGPITGYPVVIVFDLSIAEHWK
jgi:hypothetical protein